VDNHWHVWVQYEGNDLILPLPESLLDKMGWSEGTQLRWVDNLDGSFRLEVCDAEDVG
jgi:hypothetical protein